MRYRGTRRDPFESRSRRLPTLASPPAFPPGRAGTVHLAARGSFLSWNFVPCRGPVSRCPRERPLQVGSEEPSLGRRMPLRRSRSALVVSLHLGGFLRSRLPACCSRYRVRVRQVSSGSVVEAEASRAGSGLPAGAPTLRRLAPRRQPCRIAAACSPLAVRRLRRPRGRARASLRPRPRTRCRSSGSVHRCRCRHFLRSRQLPGVVLPSAFRRWAFSPVRRPSALEAGCPSSLRGVRLDLVDSPVARRWLVPTAPHLAVSARPVRVPSSIGSRRPGPWPCLVSNDDSRRRSTGSPRRHR